MGSYAEVTLCLFMALSQRRWCRIDVVRAHAALLTRHPELLRISPRLRADSVCPHHRHPSTRDLIAEPGQMELRQRRIGIALPRLQHHVAENAAENSLTVRWQHPIRNMWRLAFQRIGHVLDDDGRHRLRVRIGIEKMHRPDHRHDRRLRHVGLIQYTVQPQYPASRRMQRIVQQLRYHRYADALLPAIRVIEKFIQHIEQLCLHGGLRGPHQRSVRLSENFNPIARKVGFAHCPCCPLPGPEPPATPGNARPTSPALNSAKYEVARISWT